MKEEVTLKRRPLLLRRGGERSEPGWSGRRNALGTRLKRLAFIPVLLLTGLLITQAQTPAPQPTGPQAVLTQYCVTCHNQTAKVGTALPFQLLIRVTGGNNVPMPGQTVAISITGGGGSITPQSSVTNALGEVTVRWTLGLQPGPQSASITAGSLGPVTVNATGS